MSNHDVLPYLENAYSFLMDPAIGRAIDEIKHLRQQNAELTGDPNIKMLLAGKKALFRFVEDPTIDDARAVYESMIDAYKSTRGK